MKVSSVGAYTEIAWKKAFFGHPWSLFFSYAFHNSWLTGLIADHSSFPTQHGELLLPFHNGNSAQNSAVRKQYGIQKIRNFRFINMKVSSVGACEHLTRLSC